MQGWINEQIRAAAPRWIERYREDIRRYIVARVAEWNAAEMTRELERNIGRDLQFIRINGTLVGGLVGLAIYSATQWVLVGLIRSRLQAASAEAAATHLLHLPRPGRRGSGLPSPVLKFAWQRRQTYIFELDIMGLTPGSPEGRAATYSACVWRNFWVAGLGSGNGSGASGGHGVT